MKVQMGRSWTQKLQKQIEGFQFEVGVLDDKAHYDPVETGLFDSPQLKNYAGGPVRKASRKAGPQSTGEVLVENQKRLNIDLLRRPFEETNSDIMKFTRSFLMLAVKRPGMSIRRVENLLQAIVRNPILKQEYGSNSQSTANLKGFNRLLFDTGQMFKAIKARVKRV